jgi:hypothetical protein
MKYGEQANKMLMIFGTFTNYVIIYLIFNRHVGVCFAIHTIQMLYIIR